MPVETAAEYRNPCREWIGALIRADGYGYVSPGAPETAARLAYRDAVLSHRKNGIYGAMFVAAMIAAGFIVHDVHELIRLGLRKIPQRSRLASAVRATLHAAR